MDTEATAVVLAVEPEPAVMRTSAQGLMLQHATPSIELAGPKSARGIATLAGVHGTSRLEQSAKDCLVAMKCQWGVKPTV